jgi:hypothetical protein
MKVSDDSINVSEETAVSIFRVRIKNVTPCSLPNYLPSTCLSQYAGPIYRPILKHFKERKRNGFFPEVVVGTVDITLKKFPQENHNAQYLTKNLVSRICFEFV